MTDYNVERAKLAYETFRSGLSDMKKIPVWEKAGWIQDAVLVAYLQGRLDSPPRCPQEIGS
jgi:hypothetical protein